MSQSSQGYKASKSDDPSSQDYPLSQGSESSFGSNVTGLSDLSEGDKISPLNDVQLKQVATDIVDEIEEKPESVFSSISSSSNETLKTLPTNFFEQQDNIQWFKNSFMPDDTFMIDVEPDDLPIIKNEIISDIAIFLKNIQDITFKSAEKARNAFQKLFTYERRLSILQKEFKKLKEEQKESEKESIQNKIDEFKNKLIKNLTELKNLYQELISSDTNISSQVILLNIQDLINNLSDNLDNLFENFESKQSELKDFNAKLQMLIILLTQDRREVTTINSQITDISNTFKNIIPENSNKPAGKKQRVEGGKTKKHRRTKSKKNAKSKSKKRRRSKNKTRK